jgi:RNA polymerase-binding transcription factor DksA
MATKNKKAAKPVKSGKPDSGAKKAAPAKKAVANKNTPEKTAPKKAVSAKKVPAKPIAKKAAAPVKKAPVKQAPKSAPAKKAAPVKKAIPSKKTTPNNNQKNVTKNNSKPAPPAKKAIPVKKAAPAKKATPVVKKAAPAAKKVVATKPVAKTVAKTPAKPVAKTPAKPVAKAAPKPVAKAAPAPKKAAPPPPPPPAKKAPLKKKLTITQMPVKINPSAQRPTATPAARSIEKKPNIVIAHRRLENKSKEVKENTNTMTHYQPETYRSILDEPQQQQGPAYRYSDEDLVEFRDIITSRLEAARKELNYLQGLITRKDEAGTEDTENRYMNMEDGSGAMEREQLAQLASRQIQFMSHLEKALVRIENKTYGICRITGKLIDKARLRAVPHATLSIEAKKLLAPKPNN